MLDEDDLNFAILAGPSGGGGGAGCLIAIVWLLIVITIAIVVSQNEDECAQMRCPSGQAPKLMKHECLCVTRAEK